MPQRPDVKCSACGDLIWRGSTSLPPGLATCRACRREANPPRQRKTYEARVCPTCGRPFDPTRPNQKYCRPEHRPDRSGTKTQSTTARGYGAGHQATRRQWVDRVEQGDVACSLCGYPIDPGTPWDMDHTPGKQGYRGPAHRRCNRSEGATRGNRQRGSKPTARRRWEL